MNMEGLKCFLLVAENRSFARTAEAMHKSQPAVTKQINALEQELGVSLFSRSTRHVELTPAGMSFYKDAKEIVANTQMAVERAKRQELGENTIRIGMSNATALFRLPALLSKLRQQIPALRPDIQVLSHKVILSLFQEDKLDVLFYYKENAPDRMDAGFRELKKDAFACLVPRGHRFEKKERISVQELSQESLIICNPLNAPQATAYLQEYLLEQYPPKNVIYCDTVEIAHCMVASGLGISIMPSILCLKEPAFSAVPIAEQKELSFGMFYRKQNTNVALKKLLEITAERDQD